MKLLLKGDSHYKIGKFALAKDFMSWVNHLAEEQRPDVFVSLGDDFDTHAVLRSEVMGEFVKHVHFILALGIHYVYVIGNHDQYKPKDATYYSVQALKGLHKNFHIVDSPQDLFGITFVPYQNHIEQFPKQTQSLCIAHQTFKGASYGSMMAEDGVDPDDVSADLIISGHVHIRQSFNKVIYPGSPYSQNANDVDQVKGVMLLDSNTFEHSFIEAPFPTWRKMERTIDGSMSVEQIHTDIEAVLSSTKDHWIVDISGPKAEVSSYVTSKKYMELVKGKDVVLKTTYTDSNKGVHQITGTTMDAIVDEYVNNIYKGSVDKTALLNRALEVLKSVK